jgi:hypothetical protein
MWGGGTKTHGWPVGTSRRQSGGDLSGQGSTVRVLAGACALECMGH